MQPCHILLVGCGKMGGAMLTGWLEGGVARSVTIVEPYAASVERFTADPRVQHVADAAALPADLAPDVVVIAVKPQSMDAVVPPYGRFAGSGAVGGGTVFLSIAAGKPIGYFARHFGADAAIVRAMPNTPAAVGRGITVLVPNAAVGPRQRELCATLLQAVGSVAWVEDEGLMDAVTAVSGSGPAYVFLLIEALAAAGAKAGLPPALAMQLARETVTGSGELARRAPEDAAVLRQNVTSPGGTTAAALEVLMAPAGLQPLMDEAVAAATRRSRELAG